MILHILHQVYTEDRRDNELTNGLVTMKRGIVLVYFLFTFFIATAQNPNQGLISDFDDLSGVQVLDIKQDKTGFLWIGTVEGLYRYDGYHFKLYQTSEKVPGASFIQTLYFDSNDELWAGTRGGLLRYNKNADQLTLYRNDPHNPKSLRNNIVNSIVEDKDQNIWIALSKGGLTLLDKVRESFSPFSMADNTGLLSDDISDLHVDGNNHLWISTWDYGVNRLDLNDPKNKVSSTAQFSAYKKAENFNTKEAINFLFEDPRTNQLYVGTNGAGLSRYDKKSDRFQRIGNSNLTMLSMTPLSENKALLSTGEGVKQIDLGSENLEDGSKKLSEITGEVNVIFIDNRKVTWVGGMKGLIKHVDKKIVQHKVKETEQFDQANNILALTSQGSYLWIGTFGNGLHLKDERNGKLVRINKNNRLLDYIWDIKLIEDNYLLVATQGGLVRLDIRSLDFKSFFPEENFPAPGYFTSFSKNTEGDTWIGSWKAGIYTVDGKTGELRKLTKSFTDDHYIQAVCLDRKNQLWVGTRHVGVIRLSNLDGELEIKTFSERENLISNDFVSTIYEDKKGLIWIGTEGGGINIYDPVTEKMSWILKGDRNLPSNIVKSMVEDREGNLWVSFKNGISRYHPENGFINYTPEDGVEFFDFNYKAVASSDSVLYFGNQLGYNSLRPSALEYQEASPQVFITDFRINNRSIRPGTQHGYGNIFQKPIYETKEATLNHLANTISFEFSSLNFANPMREIYAYKLEGVSQDWTLTNASNRQVTYSSLSPGKYIFRAKVVRNNVAVEETAMVINIVPPFWQTNWFKVISFLALIGLLYAGQWIRLVRLKQQKIKFENLARERIQVIEKKNIEIQEQTERLHEADRSKLLFFANISHEFRTPLMLIIGPLTSLMENKQLQSEHEKLTIIHRNAQRLLRLMDQIMDISKIDAGSLKLELQPGDLIRFCKEICNSFDYLATFKKIQFEFKSEVDTYLCSFDQDKIEKIIYNIVSNAFKVTPQYSLISMRVELHPHPDDANQAVARIEIFNSGVGISKDEMPNLFTRFYRTRSYSDGTGIGLSLTKSLIELQGGTIDVKSEEKVGTTFTISIPVTSLAAGLIIEEEFKEGTKKAGLYSVHEEDIDASTQIKRSVDPDAKTILIVDDDDDMRAFISQLLQPAYTVIRAPNGEEAIKLAYQYQPDLIISDMIMPVMDGYQFMRLIKGDANVSHIPVILLTARASIDARLQGLEEGADDYITKPFNEKILLARVKNLIEQRLMMKKRFSTDIDMKPKEITITSLDEKFMQGLVDVVEANMAEPDFGSDRICQELGIGRSYLYSKVKALTDLSVNEFIKTQRLKRAAILLLDGKQNVNEVSIDVGFTDRSHFSKSFAKQFGIAPAQYQKQKS